MITSQTFLRLLWDPGLPLHPWILLFIKSGVTRRTNRIYDPPSSSARLRTPNDERYLGWGYLLSAPLLTSFSLMLAPLTRVSGNGRSSSSLSDTKNGSDFDIFEQQIVFGTKFLACGRGISFSKVRIVRESPSSSFPFSSSFDDESSPLPLDRGWILKVWSGSRGTCVAWEIHVVWKVHPPGGVETAFQVTSGAKSGSQLRSTRNVVKRVANDWQRGRTF